MAAHLLPTNATPLERAVALTTARVDDIPAPVVKFAQTCPESFLSVLAWELSVDIWNDDWPVERKRWVILESLLLHAIKGTLEGIRRHLALADAKVLSVVRPPAKTFLGKTMTAAERRVWLARYPQLRIYPYRSGGTKTAKAAFLGSATIKTFLADENGAKVGFLRTSDAAARFGRNAYYYEPRDGTETKLAWIERTTVTDGRQAVDFERVSKRGVKGHRFMLGAGFLGREALTDPAVSAARIYTLRVERVYQETDELRTLRTVSPSLEPIEVRPDKVFARGAANPLAAYSGRCLRDRFTVESTAAMRIYDRTYLLDPERPVDRRGAWSFLDHTRLGIGDYTAIVEVEIRGRRPKHGLFARGFVGGFLMPVDVELIRRVARATRAGKSARDKILIDTKTRRLITPPDLDSIDEATRFLDTVRG